MRNDFSCNQEIIMAARRNLTQDIWDYLTGGAESESTLRRNRLRFDSIAFRPRILKDVSEVVVSREVLGHHLRIPVVLASIGSVQTLVEEGGVAVAKAAEEFGTMCFISSVTQPSLEETAASSNAPKVYQLYPRGDLKWIEDVLGRVKEAGYTALCFTVDVAFYGHRERQMMSRWLPPSKAKGEPNTFYQMSMTWDTIDAIREIWGNTLIIKGIMTPEDAGLAVEHGVDVVYVSNHGGRTLDHSQATIDVLGEIVKAVDGKVEVFADSGIVRGSDIIKAICLGAKAVGIGKLQGWALAAAGQAGLVRALEVLEAEITGIMRLLGVTDLDQLGPEYVCKAQPVTDPTETSAFVHLAQGRMAY